MTHPYPYPTILVVGATGHIGRHITRTLLSPPWNPLFSSVICTTRSPTSPRALQLRGMGAQLRVLDERDVEASMVRAAEGVHVVINALPSSFSLATHNSNGEDRERAREMENAIVQALVRAQVGVYFPNGFGVDHRQLEQDCRDPQLQLRHPEWIRAREHLSYAHKMTEGRAKIVSVFAGVVIGVPSAHINPLTLPPTGSPQTKIAFTHVEDLAQSIAQLCLLATTPWSPPYPSPSSSPNRKCRRKARERVPDYVRVYSMVESVWEVKLAEAWVRGEQDVQVVRRPGGDGEVDVLRRRMQRDVVSGRGVGMGDALRLMIGEGKLDWSNSNDRELVNPGETLWKWTKIEEYIVEVLQGGG